MDTSRNDCATARPPDNVQEGYQSKCYLRVTSMAFRAWNRGLAATARLPENSETTTTPFGVWLYNGTRWFPDPTFPGSTVCGGNTVLWAGKLDFWLVGGGSGDGSSLCRYDGATFGWEALEIPAATRAKVTPPSAPASVTAGSCFAWNDCWFFGPEGVRLYWDGATIADHTPDQTLPWLRSRITAAKARVGADGTRRGVAAAWTSGDANGGTGKDNQTPSHPEGYAPAQFFSSAGAAFAPFPFEPPTVPLADDPWRTDLVAVDLDVHGRGWVAGNPVGYTAMSSVAPTAPEPNSRRTTGAQPAPVTPFTVGAVGPCTDPDPGFAFQWSPNSRPDGTTANLWSSLSVFPQSGDALLGGTLRPPSPGASVHEEGFPEPAVTRVRCDGTVSTIRFREPDPTTNGTGTVPANYRGWVTATAANAENDAWATASNPSATLGGGIPEIDPLPPSFNYFQRPHLYRLTDTARPSAPAGDDEEERPIEVVEDPPIFVEGPPEPEPAPLPAPPAATPTPAPAPKAKRQKAAVYSPKVSKPRKIKGNRYRMVVRFRVRRPVTIGVQALRRNKVVARSGLKRFRGKRGTLELVINRKRWPTRIRFYQRSGSTR